MKRADAVVIEAPAKVNLRLEVLAREQSGYHTVETIFCMLELCDEVEVRRSGAGLRFRVEGDVETGPAEENLVVRAARRFHAELREEPSVEIRLRKRIPAAAGLGGGSSDAAATLRALNALHGGRVPERELRQWGTELGSDVGFFLCGSPLALGWSRGERLLALAPLPRRAVLVAHPGVPLGTSEAFAAIAAARGSGYRPRSAVIRFEDLQGWEAVAALAHNDFATVAEARLPLLAEGRRELERRGGRPALLAGSGASLFGVFDDPAAPAAAASRLREMGFACWITGTRTLVPHPVQPAQSSPRG